MSLSHLFLLYGQQFVGQMLYYQMVGISVPWPRKKDKCNETLYCEPREFEPLTEAEVETLIDTTKEISDKDLTEEWSRYPAGTPVKCYAHQCTRAMSREALLAGFLSLWLRRFIVPGNCAVDRIFPGTLFEAVRLIFGRETDLTAMTCRLCAGFRELAAELLGGKEDRNEFPRAEMPFTYLFGWLIFYHPSLMSPGLPVDDETASLFLLDYRASKWNVTSIVDCRRALNRGDNWFFYIMIPSIRSEYGGTEVFNDVDSPHSQMDKELFSWLRAIRPSHLLCRADEGCCLEPYLPSRFSRQFGYDQLHVGNATTSLTWRGGLIDGARAWRYFNASGTGAQFNLPEVRTNLNILNPYAHFYASISTFFEGYDPRKSFIDLLKRRCQPLT